MIGIGDNPNTFSQFSEGVKGPHLGKKVKWNKVPSNIKQHILNRLA
jgi:hypothetical protein